MIITNNLSSSFSGFKERSPSIEHSSNSKSDVSTNHTKEPAAKSSRVSVRIQKIKEEKVYTPTELLLKVALEKQRRTQPPSDLKLSEEIARYLPRILIKMLSARQIESILDDWNFLDHFRITNRIVFRSEVIATRPKSSGEEEAFLVQLTHPSGITRTKWIDRSAVPDGAYTVDVQTLPYDEKLLVRDQLITKKR